MILELSETADIGFGIIREWYFDRRILYVGMPGATREVNDLTADELIREVRRWPAERPVLLAIEVSKNNVVTPHGRKRFSEIPLAIAPAATGRFTIIIPRGILGDTVRLFVQREIAQIVPPGLEGKAFATKAEALSWLAELAV